MKNLSISSDLNEKLFDIKNENDIIFKITSYFPLKSDEKQEIMKSIEKSTDSTVEFKSIFSDDVSDDEWNNSKKQIIKKFQDELMKID